MCEFVCVCVCWWRGESQQARNQEWVTRAVVAGETFDPLCWVCVLQQLPKHLPTILAQHRCEVCGTDYRGEFIVPPPPPPSAAAPQMLAPMFILNAESAARIAAARHHIQVLEAEQVGEGGDTQVGEGGRREPGRASWITPH